MQNAVFDAKIAVTQRIGCKNAELDEFGFELKYSAVDDDET
jgi:hypothetical protein